MGKRKLEMNIVMFTEQHSGRHFLKLFPIFEKSTSEFFFPDDLKCFNDHSRPPPVPSPEDW